MMIHVRYTSIFIHMANYIYVYPVYIYLTLGHNLQDIGTTSLQCGQWACPHVHCIHCSEVPLCIHNYAYNNTRSSWYQRTLRKDFFSGLHEVRWLPLLQGSPCQLRGEHRSKFPQILLHTADISYHVKLLTLYKAQFSYIRSAWALLHGANVLLVIFIPRLTEIYLYNTSTTQDTHNHRC